MAEPIPSFEFYRKEPFGFDFNTSDEQENKLARKIYESGRSAWWAEERQERFAEHIEPVYMYVIEPGNSEFEHRGVWVRHTGLFLDGDERETMGTYHHIVCDCVDYGQNEMIPSVSLSCEIMQSMRRKQAEALSAQIGLSGVIEMFSEFDESVMDFVPSEEGLDLIATAIENVLTLDRLHPEMWMANQVSGSHDADTLAAIVKQPAEVVELMIERLQYQGKVECRGETVKLAA